MRRSLSRLVVGLTVVLKGHCSQAYLLILVMRGTNMVYQSIFFFNKHDIVHILDRFRHYYTVSCGGRRRRRGGARPAARRDGARPHAARRGGGPPPPRPARSCLIVRLNVVLYAVRLGLPIHHLPAAALRRGSTVGSLCIISGN